MPTISPYLGHLRHLKKLIIAVDTSLENRLARLSRLTSDFVVGDIFIGLLPHLPLTNDLELPFRCEDSKHTSRNGFAAILGHFSFAIIDQVVDSLLAVHRKLPFASTPPTITLRFNVYIDSAWEGFDAQEFCEAGYLFLQQSFPLTNNGPGRKKFENKVCKFSPKDGKHHYDITVSLVYSH